MVWKVELLRENSNEGVKETWLLVSRAWQKILVCTQVQNGMRLSRKSTYGASPGNCSRKRETRETLVIVDDNSETQGSGFPGSHGQASPLTALL